jgi:hypothetical protein
MGLFRRKKNDDQAAPTVLPQQQMGSYFSTNDLGAGGGTPGSGTLNSAAAMPGGAPAPIAPLHSSLSAAETIRDVNSGQTSSTVQNFVSKDDFATQTAVDQPHQELNLQDNHNPYTGASTPVNEGPAYTPPGLTGANGLNPSSDKVNEVSKAMGVDGRDTGGGPNSGHVPGNVGQTWGTGNETGLNLGTNSSPGSTVGASASPGILTASANRDKETFDTLGTNPTPDPTVGASASPGILAAGARKDNENFAGLGAPVPSTAERRDKENFDALTQPPQPPQSFTPVDNLAFTQKTVAADESVANITDPLGGSGSGAHHFGRQAEF